MTWTADISQGFEASKVKWVIAPYTSGRTLDIGCGPDKVFPHFVGVDIGEHGQVTTNAVDLSMFADSSWDAVFSSHLLEHIEDTQAALREWWRVIKPGGYLVLYLPHKDLYPNIGHPDANEDHKHDFIPGDIIEAMPEGWSLEIDEIRGEGDEYSFLQVYRKGGTVAPSGACVFRLGGVGDIIQATSVIGALKSQGKHVTVITTDVAGALIKHDPSVDKLLTIKEWKATQADIDGICKAWAPRFDEFHNLNGSIEDALIPKPGSVMHAWPHHVRKSRLSGGYLELQHEIAGVSDIEPRIRFVPTEDESAWAGRVTANADAPIVMMSISGSAIHKVSPWIPEVAHALARDGYHVILVGGDSEKKIEGLVEHPYIWKLCGTPLRYVMALSQCVDVVVGSETGLLNAVAHEEVWKVLLLSHSSASNICSTWNNTYYLKPYDTPCYPCHRMHYDWTHCHEAAEGAGVALCAYNISADRIYSAVRHALLQEKAA